MARNIGWMSLAAILLGLLMGPACARAAETPAQDQARRQITQPGNNAPFWREVRKGENPYQTSQVRGVETNILIQSAGQTWRQVRNGPISAYGGLTHCSAGVAVRILPLEGANEAARAQDRSPDRALQ